MRNEEQVLNQILDFARNDENIRAVVLNGSRVNPNIEADIFCDYDVICFVEEIEKYTRDQSWIPYFGDMVIYQFNRHDEEPDEQYVYLMQFSDGVRIDLSFASIKMITPSLKDSLTVVLMDKDGLIPSLPDPSDASYITQKPSQPEYDLAVNEFWWVSTYVAKGLWRQQPIYAKYTFEIVLDCLNKMISWYIASQHGWKINTGKFGKYFGKYLPIDVWNDLLQTYVGIDEDEIWKALFKSGKIIHQIGVPVAENLGFAYHYEEDERVTAYLKHVMNLPKDADSFD